MPSPASPSQPALQRAAWLLLFCAALATVYGLGPVVEAWTTAGPMESSAAGSLGYMLALAATGRILMAWLPPGFPGERPETGTPSSVLISGISGRAWVRPR